MRTLRAFWLVRVITIFAGLTLVWLQVGPVCAGIARQSWIDRQNARRWVAAGHRADGLPDGLTQTPAPDLRAKIAARKTALTAPRAITDVRPLSPAEMGRARGRGPLRSPYFAGSPMPWQKSFHDVNMCDGNLFKSYTDIQVAPARGAGLVLQRTYNSDEARVGPFGIGWTHAYDIRMQEAADVETQSGNTAAVPNASGSNTATTVNEVPRTDFFGAKHTYHRDADGLYSPPPYLYDELNSDYGKFLTNGPPQVMDDTDKGMDGTVKHYVNVVTKADGTSGDERACDTITDRYGNQTSLAYGLAYVQTDGSTRQLLTQVTDPTGRSLTFQWTNFGTAAQPAYRISETDAPTDPSTGTYAYRVTYAYYGAADANGGGAAYQLKSVTLDPDGLARTTTYTYTSYTGSYTDQSGNVQSTTETGLLASVTDPLGHTVSYQYATGISNNFTPTQLQVCVHVSQISEPASGQSYVWNVDWFFTGAVSCTVEDGHFGDTTSPDGLYQGATVWSDPQGRAALLQSRAMFNNNIGWFDSYDANNNVIRRVNKYDVDNAGPAVPAVQDNFSYGQHGNVLSHWYTGFSSDNPADPVGKDVITYYNASQYFQKQSATDADGHLTSMGLGTNTAGNAGDPDPNVGDRGQTLWVQDAGYNDSSSPSYHKQSTYTYNQYGQKLTETNLNGVVTAYTYGTTGDDMGNLVQVVQDPGGAGHLNRTTTMHYDVMGRVLNSTDPASQTSNFAYNSLGQPLSVSTPAKGAAPAETITYIYGGNGRTHSVTDNRGTTTITYEDEHYGSTVGYGDRVYSVSDPMTGTVCYTYLLCGMRNTMSLPSGRMWTYAYQAADFTDMAKDDPESMIPWLSQITDDQGRTVEYSRTINQPLPPKSFSYHNNTTYQLCQVKSDESFDSQGNLASYLLTSYYNDDVPALAVGSLLPTHAWTREVSTTWNYTDASGTARQRVLSQNDYTYDDDSQRLTNTVSTQGIDGSGNPQTDGSGNPVLTSRTERYGYDALNRLKTVDYGDGESQAYTFDAMGNRLAKGDTVGSVTASTSYAFDAANRLTGTTGAGAATYASDLDGNTISDGTRTNAWNSQNRLTSCASGGTTSAYAYGADGLRRSETVTPAAGPAVTTSNVYDGTMLVQEQHSGTTLSTYLNGTRGPECRVDETQPAMETGYTSGKQTFQRGPTKWYVYDGLGSVVGEVDPSGNMTSSGTFDVYGAKRVGGTGTASTRQGFVGGLGHVTDTETGLLYMRARYYDPSTGRFISEDPSRQSSNWFRYASDNPTNQVDENGCEDLSPDELMKQVMEICEQFGTMAELTDQIVVMIATCLEIKECAESDEVEEKWDKYMEHWSEDTDGDELAKNMYAYIKSQFAAEAGTGETLQQGAEIAVKLTTLCVTYDVRETWYVDHCDD